MQTRRHFIKNISATAVALPLASAYCSPGAGADDKPLRVAIMGLGSYGTRVADAMKDCKRAKLVGVISGTPAKITAWQSKYNIPAKNCYNYQNFDSIKDNPDPFQNPTGNGLWDFIISAGLVVRLPLSSYPPGTGSICFLRSYSCNLP